MSVAPSSVRARSCACALAVASSAIASKALSNTCDASGAGGRRLHVEAARAAQKRAESRDFGEVTSGDCSGGECKRVWGWGGCDGLVSRL
jgi:hypothetical protein